MLILSIFNIGNFTGISLISQYSGHLICLCTPTQLTMATRPVLNLDAKLVAHWNKTLAGLSAVEIIRWALLTFPGLYQTTAFGLSGLCIMDIVAKLPESKNNPIDLVFVDTLYHFPQTLDLTAKITAKYPTTALHVYKPKDCETDSDFVALHGDQLWETDELKYDFLVKVEPLARAYEDLGIMAVFTGRRQSQGSNRAALSIVEFDETLQVVKINPLANWSFPEVRKYIDDNAVPYNELLDLGYKSVGDWHSTQPVADGEDERAGRWKGKAKTECGIHVSSAYSQFLSK